MTFILFATNNYYPSGGMHDSVKLFENLTSAKEWIVKYVKHDRLFMICTEGDTQTGDGYIIRKHYTNEHYDYMELYWISGVTYDCVSDSEDIKKLLMEQHYHTEGFDRLKKEYDAI